MHPGKFQMVKAALRDDGRNSFRATGQVRPVPQADPASALHLVRTFPEGTTADVLRAEILRLYRLLDPPSSASPAIERQIRALAVRHWDLTA